MHKNNDIIIQDWAGNDLFIGPVNSPEVEEILYINDDNLEDIYIFWVDGQRNDNPWEFI